MTRSPDNVMKKSTVIFSVIFSIKKSLLDDTGGCNYYSPPEVDDETLEKGCMGGWSFDHIRYGMIDEWK